jgi:hypothetical protein
MVAELVAPEVPRRVEVPRQPHIVVFRIANADILACQIANSGERGNRRWFLAKSIVILEQIVIIKIERIKHQIPIIAPNKVSILYFIVKETDWIVILVVLRMRPFDEIWFKINDIALSIGKSDSKLVFATRLYFNDIVTVHGFHIFLLIFSQIRGSFKM